MPSSSTSERRGSVLVVAALAALGIAAVVLTAVFAPKSLPEVLTITVPVIAGCWALIQASYNVSRGIVKGFNGRGNGVGKTPTVTTEETKP